MLVFHQSDCASAIKRMLSHYRHICILVLFHIVVVEVKTLYNAIFHAKGYFYMIASFSRRPVTVDQYMVCFLLVQLCFTLTIM